MQKVQETAEKIRTMEIRGAGRIAKAAAEAIRDYAAGLDVTSMEEFSAKIREVSDFLISTRPTAVSLPNAVKLASKYSSGNVEDARQEIITNANLFIERADRALGKIGKIGSRRIRDGDVIMTHCNSHAALSIITTAFEDGKNISVYSTESRPRCQGLLTIQHLNDFGIPTTLIVDSAVRYYMKDVDKVIVGADAIAANGALVNKIGTSQLALAAHEARKSFMVAAETFKFSPSTIVGNPIEIEERDAEEVIDPAVLKELSHVQVKNPAFDFTPAEYIDMIVTDIGIIPPAMAYTVIKEHLGWELGEI
ncbi:MAG: ribose 1,5-bisphosphate isomerase [Methanosarcina flavescens]|jgi:ribose 1,5-bisphosphate isomerase|uniref:Ribose 1,5-bisphosphate isomerase n=1 Tax=Methanosarcina flavescens TaxID=1715806 RepID=A0A660HRA2_9EURY|nr:ribose 1,5-bisphosphate isomerase [Methanosarcina flavescens]AYK14649.1 ribose 1,5-bisphosphate isomerase [Methanosarcina flavescens]NLK32414.1 ribose 1,5-bisphosphate isomerase [Methanosarcina flavescens]